MKKLFLVFIGALVLVGNLLSSVQAERKPWRRRPGVAAIGDWEKASTDWRLKSVRGETEKSGKGPKPRFTNLSPGRHFLEQQTATDWKITVIDVAQPDKVEELKVSAEVIA